MKSGSSRKDCLLAFLVRWVGVVAGVVEPVAGVDCGAGGLATDLIVSSPPPAANTAIVGVVAMIERTVSVANLITNSECGVSEQMAVRKAKGWPRFCHRWRPLDCRRPSRRIEDAPRRVLSSTGCSSVSPARPFWRVRKEFALLSGSDAAAFQGETE